MGRSNSTFYRRFIGIFALCALCFTVVQAQRGAQPLESLEWANFGTGNGQGYVVYTPDATGEPQYYLLSSALSAAGVSDDQQITNFSFDPATQQLTLTLEDGGTQSVSLSTLEERLQLIGNDLNIVGSSGPAVDLTPYLDNTDDQQLEDFTLVNGILTLVLEDGGSLSVNISVPETDPDYNSDPASTITNTDIANWNDDLVDDADNDPNNETDPIDFVKIASNKYRADGPEVQQGDGVVFEYILDSTITAFPFAAGAGTDDQLLTFDPSTFQLTLEDGGQVIDLSILKQSDEICLEATVNSNSHTFSTLQNIHSVQIQGVGAFDEPVRTHTQHITINNNQITFYETLDNDIVRACGVE